MLSAAAYNAGMSTTITETPTRRRRRLGSAVLFGLVAVIVATFALAACGGSKGSSTTGTAGSQDKASSVGVKFANCMHSHGVSDFPDSAISSQSGGAVGVNIPSDVRSNPNFSSAMSACRKDLPGGGTGGGSGNSAETAALVKLANCMHSHGITNFPEPNANGQMTITGGSGGVDPNSPQYKSAYAACKHFLPKGGSGLKG